MKKLLLLSSLLAVSVVLPSGKQEEGMFPLSEISGLDLNKAGLNIPVQEVFNPNGTSLIDALVRIGGCTGSFVSGEGLIITNHHCAFGYVSDISTPEKDYARNGYLAKNRQEEYPVKGLKCRITESYEDVSERVLAYTQQIGNVVARQDTIRARIARITAEEKARFPDLACEISEMFTGKSYVLFRYRELTDIRIVYVPPRAIGEFGGESDNWVWPRHNGDFSFFRAYVAKDGKTAPYAAENVPYVPKKHLKMNARGTRENDFVFILGYPGRTFRHYPASYVAYQQQALLPFVSSMNDYEIDLMKAEGKKDYTTYLAFAGRQKGLANTAKNYKGKMQGLKRTGLLQQKKAEELALQAFIKANPDLDKQFGQVLPELNKLYEEQLRVGRRELILSYCSRESGLYNAAEAIALYQYELKNKQLSKEEKAKLRDAALHNIQQEYTLFNREFEWKVFSRLMEEYRMLPTEQQGRLQLTDLEKQAAKTKLLDSAWVGKMLRNSPDKLLAIKDPLLGYCAAIHNEQVAAFEANRQRTAAINALLPSYYEVKSQWMKKSFIPDANATLRFTYGYIKGYRPADGEIQRPFTTLHGIIEKGQDSGDYEMPPILADLYKKKDYGPYMDSTLMDVPVGFLYNMDTTGGNSGSPVLNKNGEFIGVNFDRAFTATINDFAWNENYSRSIGCDARYILFILDKVAKADHLIREIQPIL